MPALPARQPHYANGTLSPVGQEVLRGALRRRGKTIAQTAIEVGISRKHLSNMLNGRVPLLDSLRARLCRAADIEPDFLVCLLDDDSTGEAAPHGAMKGAIAWHGDLTEPLEGWEMLED